MVELTRFIAWVLCGGGLGCGEGCKRERRGPVRRILQGVSWQIMALIVVAAMKKTSKHLECKHHQGLVREWIKAESLSQSLFYFCPTGVSTTALGYQLGVKTLAIVSDIKESCVCLQAVSEMQQDPLVLVPHVLCLPFIWEKTLAKE